ncbi:hypothetical protein Fleli_2611 [Bernardetia litoralis DSM 6794]|uniref:Uncharacterized protein n=1 Tax=Bernardetia litoralis (strain ATCC 23117 / DSM 6794 / NBRC 15988 / NCIMB 1366 / Fx l1 / Sio-4) TaxID=880071 RepID=I4ALY9_BERLS|nr:hypothetical protein [Bernardetia litoralis]AFM04974.1 hypothetical protein Fleli_2611 [Bernardetia litoralis DSM 6794]
MQQTIILILGSLGGAITTFTLQKQGFSVVVAPCIVGLIGALIGHYLKSYHLPLSIFAGAFVGMTSPAIASTWLIVLAGIFAGFLYKISLNIFAGFGGRLGTVAFISTLAAFYLLLAIKKIISK